MLETTKRPNQPTTHTAFLFRSLRYLAILRREELASAPIREEISPFGVIAAGVFFYWVGVARRNSILRYAALQMLLAGVISGYGGWPRPFAFLSFPGHFSFAWPLTFLSRSSRCRLDTNERPRRAKILPVDGIPTVPCKTVSLLSAPDR